MIINNYKYINGFSLVEMLVSLSIIMIISSLVFVNFRDGRSDADLSLAAQKFASDIRKVQGYSLGLKEYDDGSPATPPGGWGIRIEKGTNEYIVFADKDEPPTAKFRMIEVGTADDEHFETIELPEGIFFTEIDIDGDTSMPFFYITFIPPDPEIKISGANNETNDNLNHPDAPEALITMTHNRTGNAENILVNQYGLVDIQ